MLIVLAILSVGLLGTIIFFAFSQKSSRLLKLSALVALGLIGLSLGICAIFIIIGPGEKTEEFPIPVFSDTPQPQPKHTHIAESIVFFVIFICIMGIIAVLTIREHRKKDTLPAKPEPKKVFTSPSELELKPKETEEKKDDDDFNMGLNF